MTRAVKAGRSNATRFRVSSAGLEVRLSAFTARAGPWAAPWRRKPGRASWALPAARAQGRGVIGSLRSRPSRAMGHEVFVSKSEASFGSASRDAVAGHSCVVERHGVLRPPTRRGQSVARPRRRTGGHDKKRPRVWWCPERVTPPRWPSSGSVRPGGRRRRG